MRAHAATAVVRPNCTQLRLTSPRRLKLHFVIDSSSYHHDGKMICAFSFAILRRPVAKNASHARSPLPTEKLGQEPRCTVIVPETYPPTGLQVAPASCVDATQAGVQSGDARKRAAHQETPLPDNPYPPTATLRILSLRHKEHRHAVARGKTAKASGRHLLVLGNELSVVVVGRVPVDLRATTLRSHQTHTPTTVSPLHSHISTTPWVRHATHLESTSFERHVCGVDSRGDAGSGVIANCLVETT